MLTSGLVELVVAGARVTVPRDLGFELFERNGALLAGGRLEATRIELQADPRVVLHLVLGAGPLGLIEAPILEADAPAPVDDVGAAFRTDLVAAEVFPDFDAHGAEEAGAA